jgi:O-antigen ligase
VVLSFAVVFLAALLVFRGLFTHGAMLPYLLVAVLGLEYFGPPGLGSGLVTIPRVGLAVLFGWQLLTRQYSPVFPAHGLFFPLCWFSAFMSLTSFWSSDLSRTVVRASSLMLLLATFTLVVSSVRSLDDLRHFWRAFTLYALASAGVAVYQASTGWLAFQDATGLRVGGLGVNPTEGAFYMGIAVLIIMASQIDRWTLFSLLRRRWILAASVAVPIAGVVLTLSRGGIIGLIGGIAVSSLVGAQRGASLGRRVVPIIIVALATALVFGVTPRLRESAILRASATVEDRLGNRLSIWQASLEAVAERPILGSGIRSTALDTGYRSSTTYSAHNTPLGVLIDGGVVGLLLFSLIVFRVSSVFRRLLVLRPSGFEVHLRILISTFFFVGIIMLGHGMLFNKFLWALLALLEATLLLAKRVVREDSRSISKSDSHDWRTLEFS